MSTLSVDTIQGQTTAANVKFPAGSILQTVNAKTTTMVNVASTTHSDTGLTATITPKYSSSKIKKDSHIKKIFVKQNNKELIVSIDSIDIMN